MNTLTCDSLLIIQDALTHREKALEVLHWQAVAFGGTDPLYRNIATECAKIDKARKEVARIYEAQFSSKV